MLDEPLVDDLLPSRPPKRRRKQADVLEQEDALTKGDIMRARGYVQDPITGAWIIA